MIPAAVELTQAVTPSEVLNSACQRGLNTPVNPTRFKYKVYYIMFYFKFYFNLEELQSFRYTKLIWNELVDEPDRKHSSKS